MLEKIIILIAGIAVGIMGLVIKKWIKEWHEFCREDDN